MDQNDSKFVRVDSRDLQMPNILIWRYHCLGEVAFLKIWNQYWLVWYSASEVFVHLPCPSSNLVYRALESTLALQPNKRMIQHQSMSQCTVPTHHVSGTTLHVHILHVTLCIKCEFLPFWNCVFTIKMWYISNDCEVLSHQAKVNLPFKFFFLSHVFQWLLLAATTVEITRRCQ